MSIEEACTTSSGGDHVSVHEGQQVTLAPEIHEQVSKVAREGAARLAADLTGCHVGVVLLNVSKINEDEDRFECSYFNIPNPKEEKAKPKEEKDKKEEVNPLEGHVPPEVATRAKELASRVRDHHLLLYKTATHVHFLYMPLRP